MIRAYAELTQDQKYSKKAREQAVASGMSPKAARNLVNRNAATNTRTSSRQNYVNRLGI